MMRALAVIAVVLLAAFSVQTWRLDGAQQEIDTQQGEIETQGKKLTQKNAQLIALNILTQTNSQAQTQLYAAAENNLALLRQRQKKIEELTHENEALRRWSDTPLPDAVVRLRQRPALTGGESYRRWLSRNHPVPPGAVSTTQ